MDRHTVVSICGTPHGGDHSDMTVRDFATGKVVRHFEANDGYLRCLTALPNLGLAITFSQAKSTLVFLDTSRAETAPTQIIEHSSNPYGVAFSENVLAVGLNTGCIELYDFDDGKFVLRKTINDVHEIYNGILHLLFSFDGTWLYSTCEDGKVLNIQTSTGTVEKAFSGYSGVIRKLHSHVVFPNTILGGGADGSLYVFALPQCSVANKVAAHLGYIHDIKYTCDASKIITSSADMTIAVFHAETYENLHRFQTKGEAGGLAVFSHYFLCGIENDFIAVYDVDKLRFARNLSEKLVGFTTEMIVLAEPAKVLESKDVSSTSLSTTPPSESILGSLVQRARAAVTGITRRSTGHHEAYKDPDASKK